jgi:hypothetical protein
LAVDPSFWTVPLIWIVWPQSALWVESNAVWIRFDPSKLEALWDVAAGAVVVAPAVALVSVVPAALAEAVAAMLAAVVLSRMAFWIEVVVSVEVDPTVAADAVLVLAAAAMLESTLATDSISRPSIGSNRRMAGPRPQAFRLAAARRSWFGMMTSPP